MVTVHLVTLHLMTLHLVAVYLVAVYLVAVQFVFRSQFAEENPLETFFSNSVPLFVLPYYVFYMDAACFCL